MKLAIGDNNTLLLYQGGETMKKLHIEKLSDDKLLNRYFMAQDGGYFLKQEIPKLHKEMMARGLI